MMVCPEGQQASVSMLNLRLRKTLRGRYLSACQARSHGQAPSSVVSSEMERVRQRVTHRARVHCRK